MNQILDHSGPKKVKINRNPSDTKKIIKVFAILIILFAACIIGKGTYSYIINNNANKNTDQYSNGPRIVLKADEDLLSIEVSYNESIESVTYQWYRGNATAADIKEYTENPETTSSENDDEIVEE